MINSILARATKTSLPSRSPGNTGRVGAHHFGDLSASPNAIAKAIPNQQQESSRSKSPVVSENTFLFALYRMGYHGRATMHGFRGTASTILNEHEFNPDWIERQLTHVDADAIHGIYNSAQWLSGRRKMMG